MAFSFNKNNSDSPIGSDPPTRAAGHQSVLYIPANTVLAEILFSFKFSLKTSKCVPGDIFKSISLIILRLREWAKQENK